MPPSCHACDAPKRPDRLGPSLGKRAASNVSDPDRNLTTRRSRNPQKPGGPVGVRDLSLRRARSPMVSHPVPATAGVEIRAKYPTEVQTLQASPWNYNTDTVTA